MAGVSPWKPRGACKDAVGKKTAEAGSTQWRHCGAESGRASETLKLPSGAPRLKAVSRLI